MIVLAALLVQPVHPEAGQKSGTTNPQGSVTTRGADAERDEDVPTVRQLLAVTIGGVEHLLLFEETGLSMATRTAIAADIEQVYAAADQVSIKELPAKPPRNIFGQTYHLVMYTLHLPHYKPMLPEVLKNHFGGGIKVGDTLCLSVHEKVSHEYQEALKLKQEHSEKFRQVDEFLALFNDRDARQRAAETLEGARRFFHFHKTQLWDAYEQYARDLGLNPGASINIHPPSLLDFHLIKEMGDAFVFLSVGRFKEGPDEEEIVEKWPFIYSDGKWRMLIYPMP